MVKLTKKKYITVGRGTKQCYQADYVVYWQAKTPNELFQDFTRLLGGDYKEMQRWLIQAVNKYFQFAQAPKSSIGAMTELKKLKLSAKKLKQIQALLK